MAHIHGGQPDSLEGDTPWHDARVIDVTRSLRHLAWADAKLFSDLEALPPEVLDVRYSPDAWTVGHLAMHIVGGAEWYAYCLAGTPWTDLAIPSGPDDLRELARHLAELNALLLEQAALQDELVEFVDEDGPRSAQRSAARASFSPKTEPMLAPRNSKSQTKSPSGCPSSRPSPETTASTSPLLRCERVSLSP